MLYRLSISRFNGNFVLKGGLLLYVILSFGIAEESIMRFDSSNIVYELIRSMSATLKNNFKCSHGLSYI